MTGTTPTYICILCRYEIPADDANVTTEAGRCVCDRCWHRETSTEKPMPKELRDELLRLLLTFNE